MRLKITHNQGIFYTINRNKRNQDKYRRNSANTPTLRGEERGTYGPKVINPSSTVDLDAGILLFNQLITNNTIRNHIHHLDIPLIHHLIHQLTRDQNRIVPTDRLLHPFALHSLAIRGSFLFVDNPAREQPTFTERESGVVDAQVRGSCDVLKCASELDVRLRTAVWPRNRAHGALGCEDFVYKPCQSVIAFESRGIKGQTHLEWNLGASYAWPAQMLLLAPLHRSP